MMARVVETTDRWIGKVFDDGERCGFGWNLWQSQWPQIFFEMSDQCLTDSFAQEHSPRNNRAADVAIGRLTQQHAHVRDLAHVVHPHWHGVHVHKRHLPTDIIQGLGVEPIGSHVDMVGHQRTSFS